MQAIQIEREWELRKIKENPIFFVVSFRTINSEWKEFKKGRVCTLENAIYIAENQSVHYIGSLVKVHVGDCVLMLFDDGQMIYSNAELCEFFKDKDYTEYWL